MFVVLIACVMNATTQGGSAEARWVGAWPDALAFVAGLGVAWFARWQTTDLVWSLWLSSLVVGYAIIVWRGTTILREFFSGTLSHGMPGTLWGKLVLGALLGGGSLLLIGFFTVHFGGFHFGHSVFLNSFFPVLKDGGSGASWPGFATYIEVFERYWIFLPVAFLAERAAFRPKPRQPENNASPKKAGGDLDAGMMAPYKNVIRMHLLIFFFAGASLAKLDNFAVYAVVYAVYFFPWRLLRKEKAEA